MDPLHIIRVNSLSQIPLKLEAEILSEGEQNYATWKYTTLVYCLFELKLHRK